MLYNIYNTTNTQLLEKKYPTKPNMLVGKYSLFCLRNTLVVMFRGVVLKAYQADGVTMWSRQAMCETWDPKQLGGVLGNFLTELLAPDDSNSSVICDGTGSGIHVL